MVNTDILSMYYGGVITFIDSVKVITKAGIEKIYRKGEEIHITPAVLHMIGADHIPTNSIRLILRTLDQLEDTEILELSRLIIPSNLVNRTVYRNGENLDFTIEVIIYDNGIQQKSIVINKDYNVAISDILKTPLGSKPIVVQLAAPNQIKVFNWFLKKHLDILQLVPKKLAVSRKKWNKEGYKFPEN